MSRPPLSRTIGDRIEVRGRDLATELIGALTFTEMLLLELRGEDPTPAQVRMIDAILVSLMEHGITPSTLVTRLVLDGDPNAMQSAIAAGLLGVGSRFLGVVEEAAQMLVDARARGVRNYVDESLRESRPIPGFGHNLHTADDPRVAKLLSLAAEEGLAGDNMRALSDVSAALAAARPGLIPNAAGAVAAILADLGFSPSEARGFAVVARAAGLFAHVVDERERPIARSVWQSAHEAS